MSIWFTSDPHFSHENIIKYCNRPFENAEEMNKFLIKSYNRYVKPGDILYFLGDIGFDKSQEIKEVLSKINGTKILILGNHDRWGIDTYYKMGFSSVLESARIKIGKNLVSLSHYPNRSIKALLATLFFYLRKVFTGERKFQYFMSRIKNELKTFKNKIKSDWHICGHVHSKKPLIYNNNIDVGVDAWNFKPVSIKEIVKIIEKAR